MLLSLHPCSNATSPQRAASCRRLSYRDSSDRPSPVASATDCVLLPSPLFPPTDALHAPSSSEQQQQPWRDPMLAVENARLSADRAQRHGSEDDDLRWRVVEAPSSYEPRWTGRILRPSDAVAALATKFGGVGYALHGDLRWLGQSRRK
jgi:hypothetical protein